MHQMGKLFLKYNKNFMILQKMFHVKQENSRGSSSIVKSFTEPLIAINTRVV